MFCNNEISKKFEQTCSKAIRGICLIGVDPKLSLRYRKNLSQDRHNGYSGISP